MTGGLDRWLLRRMTQPPTRLTKLEIEEVSGVENPATELPGFLVQKGGDPSALDKVRRVGRALAPARTVSPALPDVFTQAVRAVPAPTEHASLAEAFTRAKTARESALGRGFGR
jgi:hypothetical protein